MTENIGSNDRLFRVVLGIVLLGSVFVGPQTPWGWIGAAVLFTAVVGFCPAYRLLGYSSCKK